MVRAAGCRHVPDAGHVRGAAGRGAARGRARHGGAHPRHARLLHPDAGPVRLLPPRAARVRGQYHHLLTVLFI